MKVVILCGGFGTRIRDAQEDVPKPMIRIGSYPILWHLMKYYAQFGHNDFVLALGYRGWSIKDFFLNYQESTADFTVSLGTTRSIEYHGQHGESGWKVTLAETGLKAMTGARVARIRKFIGDDEEFLLTYGDGLGNVDLRKLVDFHRSHGKICTVTGVRPPGRFGELEHSRAGIVTGFNEKPQATGGRISAGFFVCRSKIFDYVSTDENTILEQGPMQELVRCGELAMYEHDGFWHPMDTSRDHGLLNNLWEQGTAPWMIW